MAETMHWPRVHTIIATTHPEYLWIAERWRELEEQIQQWCVQWEKVNQWIAADEERCRVMWEAIHQRQATLTRRITEVEVKHEQYEALQEAHDALMLEHEDLQAAYYVAQRALEHAMKRAQKGDA